MNSTVGTLTPATMLAEGMDVKTNPFSMLEDNKVSFTYL